MDRQESDVQRAIKGAHELLCGFWGRPVYQAEAEAWQHALRAEEPRWIVIAAQQHIGDKAVDRMPNGPRFRAYLQALRARNTPRPEPPAEPYVAPALPPDSRFALLARKWADQGGPATKEEGKLRLRELVSCL